MYANALSPVRRVVTGHDKNGHAIIESDIALEAFNPQAIAGTTQPTEKEKKLKGKGGFIHLWRTDTFPAKIQDIWTDYHNKPIPLADTVGTTVRIVDMEPRLSSPMHRTVSLDFGVVLSGEVILELDNGVETIVRQGDTVVQRGTVHAWHNRTAEMARVLFVLVPSEKVMVDGKELEQINFSIN